MKNQEEYEEIMKILIIGDAKVGKTSLIKSFCHG
jgi:GTPase SAR1 family protein